jgi:AraC-like DNA-binding protein
MVESGGYGEAFGARLKIGTPVFFTHKFRNSLIAVIEVRSDNPIRRLSQPPRAEDALQLRDFPRHETWLDGEAQSVTALRAGDTTLYDLRQPQTFHINNPFHSVHFYFPRAALDARAKDILAAHLDGDLSLANLARQCGLSTAHFARAFRQSVGMPPHQWLMQHRVDHARELLLSSPMALSDIALACGFASQSHFTRALTRRVGTSPGAWRRQHRN